MLDGYDFLMRPVCAGLCRYESLKNGALDLADIARMNDALDVREINTERALEAERHARHERSRQV